MAQAHKGSRLAMSAVLLVMAGTLAQQPASAAPTKKSKASASASAGASASASAAAAAPVAASTEASVPLAASEAAAPAEAAPAEAPGLFDKVKSFFASGDKPKAEAPGDKADKSADKAKGEEEPSFFSRLTGSSGSPTKVKDIDEVFSLSAREFDPSCKSLIEPFGTTDSLLSLGKLGAKLAINNASARYGFGGQSMDLRSTLRLAGKNLNWLPMEAERMLGERMHGDMAADFLDGERKANKPAVTRANQIMQALLTGVKEELPYKFQIDVRKASGNAQALPGGFLVIDRDLVTVPKNEDKAYFALAHELAHVLQRHETRAIQARMTDTVDSFDGLRKLIDGVNSTPGNIMAYSNDIMGRFVVFSKDQEMQADACAVRLLDAALHDKKKLHQVIQSYQASLPPATPDTVAANQLGMLVENLQKMDKLGEQHPNTQARSANLQRMLAEVDKH
ncbi:M48 family metalloprotease [Pseudoduganella danionis]|uniref:M48 family metalloprotease n=1 Tax=Pseudoduganella danionis TaxID=1890295 RepID=UPI0035B42927